MSAHEQFADNLALYALGALKGDERTTLEQHLEGCSDCRRELEQLRGDSALLAFSVSGPAPPQRSRQRLMTAIGREAKLPAVIPSKKRFAWWGVVGWAAAAAMLVIAALLLHSNDNLMQQIASLKNQTSQQQAMLEQAKEVVETFTAGDASHVTLVAANAPPQPQGKAIYLRRRSSLIFLANNMPALPPQKAYELWLIPTSGAPIPAGVFKPDAHGSATVVNPPLPSQVVAKAFAITVEPEAGSLAPTSTPIMLGAGE